ncbi:protein YLS3-like [Chenopodium quinoa]|uniref:Bifunctional inhibitor/plant lipid transfer protein/seed storage helical domain-containing protein n=1 Tax=Chenopodium quinoa TaxID=63459 RepID=A0A803KLW6_CHEQI|nr:protein YLS3-like [Chenopodium quinoa]
MARIHRKLGLLSILVLLLVSECSCDINKDKEECANQLVGLATCLPYVGGQAKSPTQDCCTGLKQVLKDSKKCLCILVKDRDDPSLGLKVNSTLALSLPKECHAPDNASVDQCPALLHLAPNSPEAKVFNDFAKAAAAAPPTSGTPASSGKSTGGGGASAKETSDSGKGKGCLVAQMFYGALIWCFASHCLLT